MEHKLTYKTQMAKTCKDGKQRNFVLYFLDGVLILKQKASFEETWERGYDGCTHVENEYILNGKMYQTRWRVGTTEKREVYFPLSKRKLKELGVENDVKIICE